jgi:hypothetical protein
MYSVKYALAMITTHFSLSQSCLIPSSVSHFCLYLFSTQIRHLSFICLYPLPSFYFCLSLPPDYLSSSLSLVPCLLFICLSLQSLPLTMSLSLPFIPHYFCPCLVPHIHTNPLTDPPPLSEVTFLLPPCLSLPKAHDYLSL